MQKTKPLTLRRNFSWTFVGNLIYAASQWGMVVVLSKLGSPEIVGLFTLGFAVTAPVVMFTNLQTRVVQVTDAKRQFLFGDYLGLRIISTVVAIVAIAAITWTAGYRNETALVILLVGLAKAFESFSEVIHGLIQQNERMDLVSISKMIKGPLSLLLLSIGVYLSGSIVWGLVGLTFAWAIVLVGYDIPSSALILKHLHPTPADKNSRWHWLAFAFQPRWHLKTLLQLVWLSLPLGFVMMLISLNGNVPRYFIENYLGSRELGIFGALSYLIVAGGMVVSALAESASPRLAKYYADGDSVAFRLLMLKLVGIGTLLGVIGVLVAIIAGQPILTLLYRPEYAQRTDLFVWLMVAAGVGYVSSFLGYGITAARYFLVQVPLFAFVTMTAAIACLWLLPILKLQGAAIALIIAAVAQVLGSLVIIAHALRNIDRKMGRA
jgi:O-antigen/teichoic acid export membrane protein